MNTNLRSSEAGFALVMTVLVVLIIGSLVAAAALIGSNHMLVNRFYERESDLTMAADQGLEWARAKLNGDKSLYPDVGYNTLEYQGSVTDGSGAVLPGVKRTIYVGPSGVTSGQYGVFGTILSVVEDAGGGQVIRRSQVYQESFSKYAYFTDVEPSNISFGGGDQIFGPVHSNSPIKIYSSGATFHGTVRTAQNVPTPQYGTFKQGYEEYVAPIGMPETAELSKLRTQAQQGNTAVVGNSNGDYGKATTRIEFMAIDLNGDGDTSDSNEGFFRVYQSANADYVTGDPGTATTTCTGWGRSRTCTTTGGMASTDLCGNWQAGVFRRTSTMTATDANTALSSATRRCYLGGADSIWGGFTANDGTGQWIQYAGVKSPLLNGRLDKDYLFPITREMNPNFKGVIFVDGKVVLSGKIRGRITVAATDDIIFGDDLTYVTDPGAGTCVDIAGYFAGDEVIVADNALNAPQDATGTFRTYDDTKDEFFHGTVLALDIFTVHNYSSGSTSAEDCGTTNNGRGCLFLTGGIIQQTRGAVGTTSGTGYIKRYSYDQCGATNPPPYFPTTGYFAKGQYYNVDPVGFNVASFFDLITPS
ncbi:MAG: hypothetical protein AMXMBFR53_08290 [Gemmatimonadota bacterium]